MAHYNAFIFYNHNSRDSRIAENIQRRLENYRVPKDLRKNLPRGRIQRVFLDKGELEAGDLNDKVRWALEHTDRLIVICSPDAKASPWVKKEIETFLRYHDKDDILTVLAEGEPNTAMPEELLFIEEEGASGEIRRIPKEPLACDYRGNLRQANRTELPRLAAALIGYRYDDLMQRQRQYRMRKLAIVFGLGMIALAIALGCFIWSNGQIQKNYNQTLREQSKGLALQSAEALGEGDRMEAIRYALTALPSGGSEPPGDFRCSPCADKCG